MKISFENEQYLNDLLDKSCEELKHIRRKKYLTLNYF